MQALAQYDFHPSSDREIGFRANQILTIAPQTVQGNLWNSGWLLASVDQKTSGLVPVNYFKIIRSPNPSGLRALPNAPNPATIQINTDAKTSSVEAVDGTASFNNVTLNAEPVVRLPEKNLKDSVDSQ